LDLLIVLGIILLLVGVDLIAILVVEVSLSALYRHSISLSPSLELILTIVPEMREGLVVDSELELVSVLHDVERVLANGEGELEGGLKPTELGYSHCNPLPALYPYLESK
jgi:hypothetical protein